MMKKCLVMTSFHWCFKKGDLYLDMWSNISPNLVNSQGFWLIYLKIIDFRDKIEILLI